MKLVIATLNITQYGGTERAIHNLVQMLYKDYEILIYSLSSGKDAKTFYEFPESVKIVHLAQKQIPESFAKKIKWFYNILTTLKKQTKSDKPDFMLGTGHNINFLLPYLDSRAKIFGAEHIDIDTISRFSRLLMSFSYPKLDGLVVLSDKANVKAEKLNNTIKIIPNVIKTEQNLPKIDHTGKKKIIMVGRIGAEKGYDRIIPIAKYLQENYANWEIDIYGDGPVKESLANQLNSENLKNVNLHGITKNIKEKYLESSIFMLTSYTEAMPMVVLEAKSFALPVIAYRNEGTELLIDHGVNGFLVDNPQAFIQNLETIIQNKEDIITRFRLESDKQLQEYSEEEIKKMWISLLKK